MERNRTKSYDQIYKFPKISSRQQLVDDPTPEVEYEEDFHDEEQLDYNLKSRGPK